MAGQLRSVETIVSCLPRLPLLVRSFSLLAPACACSTLLVCALSLDMVGIIGKLPPAGPPSPPPASRPQFFGPDRAGRRVSLHHSDVLPVGEVG